MITNVGELKALLEDHDDATPLLIATQPGWPLAFTVAGATTRQDDGREQEPGSHDRDDDVLWIVAGSHPDDDPYAPGWVFESAGLW